MCIFLSFLEIKFIYSFSSSFGNAVKFLWLLLIWFYLSEKCTFHRSIFRSFSLFLFSFSLTPLIELVSFPRCIEPLSLEHDVIFRSGADFCQTAKSKFIAVFANPTNFSLPLKLASNLGVILNFHHSKPWKFPWKSWNFRDCSWNVDILRFSGNHQKWGSTCSFWRFRCAFFRRLSRPKSLRWPIKISMEFWVSPSSPLIKFIYHDKE